MALHHKWDIKNDFPYVLKFFSLISDSLGSVRANIFQRPKKPNLAIYFSVCLDVYKIGEAMRILPCSHRFHKACIDQWLLDKRTCPMCKMDILKHYGLIGDSDMMNFEERDESLLNLT